MEAERAGSFERPAVIFDFDGTLVDTGPAVISISAQTLEAYGFDLNEVGDLRLVLGPPLVDGFMLVAGVPRELSLKMVETYRALFDEQVTAEDYPPFPGIPELLQRLREQGFKTAIATSRLDGTTRKMLEQLDLPPFDAVAGRLEPGRASKADCIRACLEGLGVASSDAVMVGDRHTDVDGAHELGMPCIGVYGDDAARAELVQAGADALCASSDELANLLGVRT